MSDDTEHPGRAVADRIAYLTEQLAALDGYGNGGGSRAAAVRAELDHLAAARARTGKRKAAS